MSDGPVELIVEDDAWLDEVPDLAEVANRGASMALAAAGLLWVSLVALESQAYNPFIYFIF